MADNVAITAGTGTTIAADDIGGVLTQRVKVQWGPDGTVNDADVASGKMLPVQLRASGGTEIATATNPAVAKLSDGTNAVAVKAASTAPIATDPALVVAISPNSVNANGQAAMASSAPVVIASNQTAVPVTLTSTTIAAGSAIIGKVTTDQTTHGTSDLVAADVTKVGGAALALGSAASAASVPAVIASDQTWSSIGHSSAVTLTRTSDTNAYAVNDVIGAATGSTAALTFASMGQSGKEILITSIALEIDATAVLASEVGYRLYLYNITPPSALGDNAAWDLPSGDRASFLGYVDLGTPVDLGSTLYVETNSINKQVKLSGTSLFAYLITNGNYTPTSARVYVITLHSQEI